MKTKVLKIMVTFIILICLIMIGSCNVFAVRDPAEIPIIDTVKGDEEIEELGEQVLGIITVVGYAMAIIISIIIGIKYMTGSVEEKAGYKKSMIPYIVGCVILVAAPTLTNVVYDASKPLKTSAVIQTSVCEKCGKIKEENCEHKGSGRFKSGILYCTGCEKTIDRYTCPTCGATYKGD